MAIDHRSAAGNFGSLVAMRKQHFLQSEDGAVSATEVDAYRKKVEEFKADCEGPGVSVAIFGKIGSGAFVTTENASFLIEQRGIGFDWNEAQRLLHRAEAIADQASEWWPWEKPSDEDSRRQVKRREAKDLERRPHLDRAFGLMSAVLSAVSEEGRRLDEGEDDEVAKDVRSGNYKAGMQVIEEDIDRCEGLLYTAAQRNAQLTYTTGMLSGVSMLLIVCALIGGAFLATGTAAASGVALLAGGLGAVVSVMQRMTSGALKLDVHAGDSMLFRFGALRPAIGGILGLAVSALFAAGLLPAISVDPGAELAFYGGIGFLAGFNERFAQDMIATSGKALASR